jgi:hypothetical protein
MRDEIVNEIYDNIKNIVTDKLTASNIIIITINLMKIIEKYKKISGNDKKTIVLDILKKVVNETIDDKQEKDILLFVINNTLPFVIDTIISIDKREIKIKMIRLYKKIINLFNCVNKKDLKI